MLRPVSPWSPVSVLGNVASEEDALVAAVRVELGEWFGAAVSGWRWLRTYSVKRSLPQSFALGPAPTDGGASGDLAGRGLAELGLDPRGDGKRRKRG